MISPRPTLQILVIQTMCVSGRMLAAASPDSIEALVRDSGIQGGLIVHVGCGDGQNIARMRARDSFIVQGLDADPSNVATAREVVRGLGCYGPVSIMQWTDVGRLPYADNMVNLLLMEDNSRLNRKELLRVLAPRGVARVKLGNGAWSKIVKPWPQGLDEWTHWDHGSDGNAVSRDVIVGPPRQTQWIDGPSWSKKHWGPRLSAMVTAGGRLFYVQMKPRHRCSTSMPVGY